MASSPCYTQSVESATGTLDASSGMTSFLLLRRSKAALGQEIPEGTILLSSSPVTPAPWPLTEHGLLQADNPKH